MNYKSTLSRTVTAVVFLLLVSIYFFRKQIGLTSELMLDITKTAPVLSLSIATLFCSNRKLISLALLLSAAGDLAGEKGAFIAQISLFALAHIVYILDFTKLATFNRRSSIIISLWAVVVVIFGIFVIGNINSSLLKVACALYMIIIGTMAATTFAINSRYRALYVIAALLFVFSDSCIAWNKFVEHFAGAGVAIMSTYFAAQGLFAWLATKEEKN